ncbi:MAG TPA: iron-containing alcohol dehydrogenase [Bryobacteraceae bacterium]|nr:iron-containing alcohol dehydrogenase [Bryobacteraceae bacterium]
MNFDFATAGRIVFGQGTAKQVPGLVRSFGSRPLVVTGRTVDRGLAVVNGTPFAVPGEPTVDLVRSGVAKARAADCDAVVAVGGGSAIDAAKAIAALVTNSGEPLDYLEVIGRARPLEQPPLPFIAVPTTAGTGSEVTRNAVLGSPGHAVKASLRSPLMLARVALIDPELSVGLPAEVTASTGLDALTQLIEPYVSVRANAMTDVFCLEGMCRVRRSLARAHRDGTDLEARADMSFAALLGGLALANAGLGAVHGFAAPIGGMFDAPHGAVCAALLPHAVDVNVQALREREPESEALRRYDDLGWVRELCSRLGIPPLRRWGVTADHVPELVEKAAKASSMKGNPIVLTRAELTEIVERAL